MFYRARLPSLSWGVNGEILEVIPRIISLVVDEDKLSAAIESLKYIGFLKATENAVELDRGVANLLQDHLQSRMWLPKAAKIVFHALPKYPLMGTQSFVQQCRMLLPHAARLFPHLTDQQLVILLEQMDHMEMIESCLFLSHFRDKSWKAQALSVASKALSLCDGGTQHPLLLAKIQTREYFLSVMFPDDEKKRDQAVFPICDHRSNAFAADLAIMTSVLLHTVTPLL
ncbi:uncharacterized protein F4822DRAFT_435516 [Hypoxylon trugodes]|uniref:uncharacterized protein n=1 Tax=Hypoxylon trugodes TaxID=326681 RepID=UPI00219E91D3|nr:uncharacterized protein F4822DRAFT_435516 [Hypoxylon trugodes]KAI1382505.1 hypothetical protein F4822DRAFT_435516 [Hypoxylon trugodes]